MNGKITWSNLITPGVTSTVIQIDCRTGIGIIMLDQQLWCEAHQKPCQRFGFGIVHPSLLGDGFAIEPTDDPLIIP